MGVRSVHQIQRDRKQDEDFYPENKPPPAREKIELDDAIIGACSTLAFAVPGGAGVALSAGLSLGWVIFQNMELGKLTDATSKSVLKAQESTYDGKDLKKINSRIRETISWLSDNQKSFLNKDITAAQLKKLSGDDLKWLEAQSKPDGILLSIINDLVDMWGSWFDDAIEQSLGHALTCYFLAFNRRCWIYAHQARFARSKATKGDDDSYNTAVAALDDCIDRMKKELSRKEALINQKIKKFKDDRSNSFSDMYREQLETDTSPFQETTGGRFALGAVQRRVWKFNDETAGRAHALVYEDRNATDAFLVFGCSYEWEEKKAEARERYNDWKKRLSEHIERHYILAPRVLEVCKQYLSEAEKILDPVGPLPTPMILGHAKLSEPDTRLSTENEYAYRYTIERDGSSPAIKSPWLSWIGIPDPLSSPKILLEDGRTPVTTIRRVYRMERPRGSSINATDEDEGEEVASFEAAGFRVWADCDAATDAET
ncbi:hypothetical protein H2199_007469 [Coniosporium tulheliwenetii]|uniref:Uncharacterized protein n=1 Tax=Coniosporium tulheliwenetii TaxID=3383036 RepID=A0ACC2YP73_9PEZI|nr:hypothetical protein H2199_007469 [Cladosporium sp. JES 115]